MLTSKESSFKYHCSECSSRKTRFTRSKIPNGDKNLISPYGYRKYSYPPDGVAGSYEKISRGMGRWFQTNTPCMEGAWIFLKHHI